MPVNVHDCPRRIMAFIGHEESRRLSLESPIMTNIEGILVQSVSSNIFEGIPDVSRS